MDQATGEEIRQKAKRVKMLVMDVDGVLTEGNINIGADGELFKSFSIKDGLGIKLLRQAGIRSAIITGRESVFVAKRAQELAIDLVMQNREDKRQALHELAGREAMALDNIAYIGDDLPDLGAIIDAGLGATVADAHIEVKSRADWTSKLAGGHGAVRELADFILTAQNQYQDIIESFC